MLFTYPLAATGQNWISTSLIAILRTAIECLQESQEPADFDTLVPNQYEDEFARGKKFPDLYVAFVNTCRPLSEQQRDSVLEALEHQNDFPGLLSVNGLCPSIVDTLPDVHKAARALFEYAFGKVSDLRTPGDSETIRFRYHQVVHAQLPDGCCPFCGLEILEAPDPDLVKPDLDHYLAVSKYPFAGANLRNLTAMGTMCNRSYKGALDILFNEDDQRVDCIDPYGQETVSVSLAGTILLPGQGAGPSWSLSFVPDQRSRNWRRIFAIEARFKATVLEKRYQTWLGHCVAYAREKGIDLSNRAGALEAVSDFRSTCQFDSLPTIARLKADFFGLVEDALGDPQDGDRMHNFIAAVAAL